MKTEISIETGKPEKIRQAVEPSLRTDDRVDYSLETENGELRLEAETESLGVLRGCSDTIFRLAMLAEKLYYR